MIPQRQAPDDTATPSASGPLATILNYLASMIKKITGTTNWYDAPATTLAAAKSHMDSTENPHNVTATQVGAPAQTDFDSHLADTNNPHSVTASQLGADNILTEIKTVDGSGSELDADKVDGEDASTLKENARTLSAAKLVAEVSSTAPSSPVDGQIWYDSTNHRFKGYADGVWVDLITGETGDTETADRLYHCSRNPNNLFELNPDTLEAINTAASPSNDSLGIGGIIGRLYHCGKDPGLLYELNPDTLGVINTASGPAASAYGIGGMASRLYHCEREYDRLHELNPDTFFVINYAASPRDYPTGIGGIADRLYHCDSDAHTLYELNPDTLGVINNVVFPAAYTYGIGGIANRLYHCCRDANNLYELNPDTLEVINIVAGPSTYATGIGGTKSAG